MYWYHDNCIITYCTAALDRVYDLHLFQESLENLSPNWYHLQTVSIYHMCLPNVLCTSAMYCMIQNFGERKFLRIWRINVRVQCDRSIHQNFIRQIFMSIKITKFFSCRNLYFIVVLFMQKQPSC